MKKLASLLLVFVVVLLVQGFHGGSAAALGLPACSDDNSCTEKEICEFENLDRNWPKPTGYHRDCSQLASSRGLVDEYKVPLAIAGGMLVTGAAGYLIIRKTAKRK